MAVDLAASRAEASGRAGLLSRLTAIPVGVAVAGIVALSFVFRFLTALAHATPLYFPDEYIYTALARSLAESGRPLVRGGAAHFPALLEPLLAAPFSLSGDPALAYRLTQAEHALAMSLAAIPAFLIGRKLGLGAGLALGCAAVSVAVPDLFYSSFVLADPIAYPLVLAAIYAGTCALEAPTRRAQLAFLGFAGLAAFARVQYVFLPLALLGAALIVERGRLRVVVRAYRLSLALVCLPVVVMAALGPGRFLGYYSSVADLHVRFAFLRWVGNDVMLLAYAAGWILVPGALVGIACALVRPRTRAEGAFAALSVLVTAALLLEAGLYASNGADRFQERYLFVLLALIAPAFGLYVKRGWPGRRAVPLLALVLLALSARVPLSGFTVADAKQDSPFLFAVFRLERLVGDVANGSLVVAVAAAVLSLGAGALALSRRRSAAVPIGLTLVLMALMTTGAVSFDSRNARNIRSSFLPADARWIDSAGLGPVDLLQTQGAPPDRSLEHLFWNRSVKDVLLLGRADKVDAFDADRISVSADGSLMRGREAVQRALLVASYGVRVRFRDATLVRTAPAFELWRPEGTPRLALLVSGLHFDGWLSRAGRITLWPERKDGLLQGTLRLDLSLPSGTQRTPLRLKAPGVSRTVVVPPAGRRAVALNVDAHGPWTLRFRTAKQGFLTDGRPISVRAATPVFSPAS